MYGRDDAVTEGNVREESGMDLTEWKQSLENAISAASCITGESRSE